MIGFTAFNASLFAVIFVYALTLLIKYRVHLGCEKTLGTIAFILSFALKAANWILLLILDHDEKVIFETVDVAASQLVMINLYCFTFGLITVKTKLES